MIAPAVLLMSLASPAAQPEKGLVAAFPNVRVDVASRTVEFDATVPIRLDDPRAPRVYLEQLVCIRDTKEHESLLVSLAKPSHIHAALLTIGLEPGKPARWRQEGDKMVPVAPEGDPVRIELIYTDRAGDTVVDAPRQWIVRAGSDEPWPEGNWLFAGSISKETPGASIYDADASGTVIGISSFGTELLAWSGVISPDSQVQEPEWIANPKRVPPINTQVTVRLTPIARQP